MSTINERIQLIVDKNFKGNVTAFSKAVGVTQSTIRDIVKGRMNKPSTDTINKIINVNALNINPEWLISGEGEMLKSEAQKIESPNIKYVPMVSQYAYAGYLSGFSDEEYIESLPKIPFIVDNENYKGKYVCFEVKGDSMNNGTEESILEGDRLLCRMIKQDLWRGKLHYNKWDFVIVHKTDGILIKRINEHNIETGDITIHSLNELYEDRVINLKDVAQLFNVVEISRPRRR